MTDRCWQHEEMKCKKAFCPSCPSKQYHLPAFPLIQLYKRHSFLVLHCWPNSPCIQSAIVWMLAKWNTEICTSWGKWSIEHAEGTLVYFISVVKTFQHWYHSCLGFFKHLCRLSAGNFKGFIALVKEGVLFQSNVQRRIYKSYWLVFLNFNW